MTLLEQLTEATGHVKMLVLLSGSMEMARVQLCGYYKNELQVFEGIKKLAKLADAELLIAKFNKDSPEAYFTFNGVRVFQLGRYVTRESVFD